MKYRRGVFIIVYAKNGKVKYLLLKRKLHWKGWEFPKGGLKKFETKKKAVKREIREETGLKILRIKEFNVNGKYKYDRFYDDRRGFLGQSFSLYAVEVAKKKVKLDKREHSDYKWLLFSDAVKKLKWPNQRRCLNILDKTLQGQKV